MKKAIILSILVFLCGQASALTVFITDTVITDGDNFDYIQTFDNATVDIVGGNVTEALVTFGSNTINVSGGYVNGLGTNLGDGTIFNIFEGANISKLTVSRPARSYINGGSIGIIDVSTTEEVNLTGGIITDYLVVSSAIDIYGYNFNYDPFAGDYDGGQLTGFWLDDTAFSIDLKNYGGGDFPVGITYDNLNLVPEPATLALFGLGGLLICRRKNQIPVCKLFR